MRQFYEMYLMILQQFEIHLIKIPFQWHWWEYILLAMHVAHAHYDSVSSEMLPLGGGGGKIAISFLFQAFQKKNWHRNGCWDFK